MSASGYYNESNSGSGNQHYNQPNRGGYPPQQQPPHGYQNQQYPPQGQYGGYSGNNMPPQQQYYGQNQQQQPYYGQNQQQSQSYNQQSYGGGYGAPPQSLPYGSPAGQPYPHLAPPSYGAGGNNDDNQYPPHRQDDDNNHKQNQNHSQTTSHNQQQQPSSSSTGDLQWGYGDGTEPVPSTQDPNNPDGGERGFLGAVAGGAAGAYGGHKVGHGVIGGIGGAIAGSKLEDYAKEKKKEKKQHEEDEKNRKEQEQRQQQQMHNMPPPQYQQYQQQQQGGGGGEALRGNFSGSARDIRLQGAELVASLADRNGQQRSNGIDLNRYISNEWGRFKWVDNGGNFSGSSRGIRLVDNGRVLEAELGDGHGGWNRDHIRLDERIGNDDGRLVYLA